MMRTLTALAMLTTATACSRSGSRTYDVDRGEKEYRAAMADYVAGKLESARKGFEEAVRANPINAAARFQLACVMQDHVGDPLAAYVEYKAFLRLDPNGDRARIAADRAQICLKQYQTSLLKASSGRDAEIAEELEKVRAENDSRRTKIVSLERDVAEAKSTITAVTRENKRLHELIEGFASENESGRKDISREAELFGSDDESDKRDILAEAKEIARIAKAEDAVNGADSSLLPKQSADAKQQRDAKRQAKKEKEAKEQARTALPSRPATYTVVEGDSLYRIAEKFYGNRNFWRAIRNANREKISNDCKLRIGDVLKLP